MRRLLTRLAVLATCLAGAVGLAAPHTAAAQTAAPQGFSDAQKQEIGTLVREYLLKNPEVLQEAMAELEKRQQVAEAERQKSRITELSAKIFDSPRGAVIGNPKGDVTLVEFFDYNCGFCKRALSDLQDLVKSDPKLRVVLKEFPVLGPGSVEAARVAAAAKLQIKGDKYFEFHQKLMSRRGQADKAAALEVARSMGLDVARIERDLDGPDVRATLQESMEIAEALGLNGTPSYIVGDQVVVGAVGFATLQERIREARRCKETSC
jgi:protein-disulfide isomerase